jgi:uncharacterized protein
MMWDDLLAALALTFVIEGLLPFISPATTRESMSRIGDMSNNSIRIMGFVSMIAGIVLLSMVR